MAEEKSSLRTIFEGVAIAALVGAGTWAMKLLPVVGNWLNKEAVVSYWVIVATGIMVPVLFVVAFRVVAHLVLNADQVPPHVQLDMPTPQGLNLAVLTALRTVDDGYLSEADTKRLLQVLGLGVWPQADVGLALRELVAQRYASYSSDVYAGRAYSLSDHGIRLAQREGIAPKSPAELRQLRMLMNTLQD